MKLASKTQLPAVANCCRTVDAVLVVIGSGLLDIHVHPQGRRPSNKQDARFQDGVGGSAFKLARHGPVNGIPTAVIMAQGAGWASHYCREKAAQQGLRLLLQERDGDGPALSIILPNGQPGRNDIYTQRMAPPTVAELTPEMAEALGVAQVVVAGPMAFSAETQQLLFHLPALAPQAFLALLPHPSLLGAPSFALLAPRYHYVQVNADESRLLDGAASDLVLNARRLSFLVGEESACAVTNGAERGFLWANGRWLDIRPKKVDLIDDTACGDSFAAAFPIGWRLLGLGVEGALLYAVEAAAATATQVGMAEPLPYRKVGGPG
jgi:sugar/nucleoside kinase (ribokinase family)